MTHLQHRLFFGLAPSARTRTLIGLERDQIVGAKTPVTNERLHLTLAITEEYSVFPEQVARRMQMIGDNVAVDPFPIAFDRVSGGSISVALRPSARCALLANLHLQLFAPMRHACIDRAGWRYSPHVTLVYWEGQPFLRPISPIILQANDFVLIHSLVGATVHRELARWPLASNQRAFAF